MQSRIQRSSSAAAGYVPPLSRGTHLSPVLAITVSHGDEKPWDQHSEQKVPIHEEERKHGWDALSDERKKQIEVSHASHLPLCSCSSWLFRSGVVSLPDLPLLARDSLHTKNTRRTRMRLASYLESKSLFSL